MYRLSTIACLGMLTLTVAGCGSGNQDNSATTPSVPPVVTTQPTTQPFQNPPVVTQNPPTVVALAPGLIQSTNANQRAQQVPKGRKDPFAALFKPVFVTPQPNLPVAGVASNAGQSGSAGNRNQPSASSVKKPTTSVASQKPSNSSNPTSQTQPTPSNALPPVLPSNPDNIASVLPPPLPEPELAQGVAVMGVIQVGEQELQAIVKVPDEPTSRYVSVGQRLSDGQVLVKRIEMNESAEPIVILEQYGVEVAKAVGEEPENSSQPGTPTSEGVGTPADATAILPPPPPPINPRSPGA